jgi:Rps23 Pro-64 3,4-dihydroxylase Tpa1-like proline 4-hydroxylase
MVMKKRQLAPGIFVYSDVIENHETLVQDIEEGVTSARIEWIQSQIKKENSIETDTSYRDTMTLNVLYKDHIVDEFLDIQDAFVSNLSNIFLSNFAPLELDYKIEHQLSTDWHDQYSVLKYGVGQKFVNHVDDHKDYHRRISTIYYLNDNYSGGEIVFPRFDITYKPVANEFIIFPSNFVYNHAVLPVKEGTRYAVVSWLT